MKRATTSVTITDPLVRYRALVATGVCLPDTAQHRLAKHLHKIYLRLKDYTPGVEYGSRLRQVKRAIGQVQKDNSPKLATESHPIWRNPLFARLLSTKEDKDSLALTKVLTSREAAIAANSPRGLFLSGDVGTGKSMLLDLLADGLPTSHKRRWHFNTFILHTLSRLEQFRRSHPMFSQDEVAYSLMWMAKELVDKSPVLFLDEFQLPDRAASKLISTLFIIFFQLGGVLVASSNRMPEELENATGIQYTPPSSGGLIAQFLGLGRPRMGGELYGSTSDFSAFLDVLKARCDFWHIEGTRDWRRREVQMAPLLENPHMPATATENASRVAEQVMEAEAKGIAGAEDPVPSEQVEVASSPFWYYRVDDGDESWHSSVVNKVSEPDSPVWKPAQLVVYGRALAIPRQHNGVAYWDFDQLVRDQGPADYLSLASNYHTFIIDKVPVLTAPKKNEARRFITFLDALYESRCKLFVRAAANPDDLFFPETRSLRHASTEPDGRTPAPGHDDATYSETIAEIHQDQMSPFRPNISSYSETPGSGYNPDQDSDFGYDTNKTQVDFTNTVAFTGEDERFAYKRAASRLWELCSTQWHARDGVWWQPLPLEARHWEGLLASKPQSGKAGECPISGDVQYGPSRELDEPAGLARLRIEALRKLRDGEDGRS